MAKAEGIRRLRRTEQLKVIPIANREGKIYKAYKGDSNWGIEIFSFPEGHKNFDKWVGLVISRYKANQPDFRPGFTYRPHPAAKLVMRLQINDCIEIQENGSVRIMRLQKLKHDGTLTFAPHNEANVDARNRDKEDSFKYWNRSPNALRKFSARKIHISPIGIYS